VTRLQNQWYLSSNDDRTSGKNMEAMGSTSRSVSGASNYRQRIAEALSFLKEHKPDRAITAFHQALAIRPDHVQFDHHYYLGISYQQTGQLEKAAACYRQALETTPHSDEIYLILAGCLQAQNDSNGAQHCYRQVLRNDPSHPKAAFSLGTLYLQQNKIDKALKWLLRARDAKPDWGLLQNNLGRAFLLKNDQKRAHACFQKALREAPNQAEVWFNLADIYAKTGELELAVSHYSKALELDPAMIAAHNNMGNVLKELKRYDEAIVAFQKVVALAPDLAQGHYNLGGVYRLNEDYENAVGHLSKAIQLQPDYADAWNNLALTCKNVGDLDRSVTYFNRALKINPDHAEARWNRSFVHFLKGNWPDGWQDFEARFKIPQWRTIYPHQINGWRWDGAPIPDKTLLVHDEQGLGDTIQFSRMLPWARERCKRLILETREELIPLLQNNPAIDGIIVRSATDPPSTHFDAYIPLMSLARLARITPQQQMQISAYIIADIERANQWEERLPKGRIRVGVVWAGRPQHGNDANRSLNFTQLAPLFRNNDIQFIGLQKGPAAEQAMIGHWPNFHNIGSSLENFADTAAVLSRLDLLITVDTAVAHLAGAMGGPVWVLIPFIPDWRWGMEGEATAWYPGMRLHRQHRPKEWGPVIVRMGHQLEKLAQDVRRRDIGPAAGSSLTS
jgi:tetratricopeptide (TPR) repeat protein